MQSNSAQSLEQLDPFDHAFVDAVLRIRGVDEVPTLEQFKRALVVLDSYYRALMKAPPSSDPMGDDWLCGNTIESAAAQCAFLFTQYGLLYRSLASRVQLEALAGWWRTGECTCVP